LHNIFIVHQKVFVLEKWNKNERGREGAIWLIIL